MPAETLLFTVTVATIATVLSVLAISSLGVVAIGMACSSFYWEESD